MKCFKD